VKYTLAHAFYSKHTQRQTLGAHQQEGGDHYPLAPPGKVLILSPGLGLENFQMKKARSNWRGQERKTGFGHRSE